MRRNKLYIFVLFIVLIVLSSYKVVSQCVLSQLIKSHGYSINANDGKNFQSILGIDLPVYGKAGDFIFTSPLTATTLITNTPDQELESVKVYPNPVLDLLWVKAATDLSSEFKLYDMNGKILVIVPLSQEPINLGGLLPGLYYAYISNGKKQQIIKIIKL